MDNFACYHKPTKCWVFFKDNKEGKYMICLCLKQDASIFDTKQEAEETLKKSSFNDILNYGEENFLEFKVVPYDIYLKV